MYEQCINVKLSGWTKKKIELAAKCVDIFHLINLTNYLKRLPCIFPSLIKKCENQMHAHNQQIHTQTHTHIHT